MLYYTILYYTILYYTILYYIKLYYTILCYTILGIKDHVMPVESQCCKVKLSSFITQGRKTVCNQRI